MEIMYGLWITENNCPQSYRLSSISNVLTDFTNSLWTFSKFGIGSTLLIQALISIGNFMSSFQWINIKQ